MRSIIFFDVFPTLVAVGFTLDGISKIFSSGKYTRTYVYFFSLLSKGTIEIRLINMCVSVIV